jgi:hypothetical protein
MRKLALGTLLLLALVAPLAFAASAEAARPPVRLKLISLTCNNKNDIGSPDEAILQIKGQNVFGPVDMSNGDTVDLRAVDPIRFRRALSIDLIDFDGPGANDFLGTVVATRAELGQGQQQATFQQNGADYTLVYKVVSASP